MEKETELLIILNSIGPGKKSVKCQISRRTHLELRMRGVFGPKVADMTKEIVDAGKILSEETIEEYLIQKFGGYHSKEDADKYIEAFRKLPVEEIIVK